MFRDKITSEEINTLPLRSWGGETIVITEKSRIFPTVKEVQQYGVIAFDTESKPAFRKGEYNPVALLQIAIPGKVFLIRINSTGFTKELAELFASDKIIKVGVAINDDIKELQKFKNFKPRNVLDLAGVAVKKGIKNAGVRGLTGLLLGFRISKRQQTSNWENKILTPSQIDYASTDAWVCLGIYEKLLTLPDQS